MDMKRLHKISLVMPRDMRRYCGTVGFQGGAEPSFSVNKAILLLAFSRLMVNNDGHKDPEPMNGFHKLSELRVRADLIRRFSSGVLLIESNLLRVNLV